MTTATAEAKFTGDVDALLGPTLQETQNEVKPTVAEPTTNPDFLNMIERLTNDPDSTAHHLRMELKRVQEAKDTLDTKSRILNSLLQSVTGGMQTSPGSNTTTAPAGPRKPARFENEKTVKECLIELATKNKNKRWSLKEFATATVTPVDQGGAGYKSTSPQFTNMVRTALLAIIADPQGKIDHNEQDNTYGYKVATAGA